jgi:hypothetical protein
MGRGAVGQVTIEAAITLPVMVLLGLGILQLTLLQHARLMTEYAAFRAARAGIVWNGNNVRMRDAALMALLPTMGRTDDLQRLSATYLQATALDQTLRTLRPGGEVPEEVNGASLLGQVRVDTVAPSLWSGIGQLWNLPGAHDWQELDFDGPGGFPDHRELGRHIEAFFEPNLAGPDPYRDATVLRIRLRYLYELRIPFANWMVFASWYAANAGASLMGAIGREQVNLAAVGAEANILGGNGDAAVRLGELGWSGGGIRHQAGHPTLQGPELEMLWSLARARTPLGARLGGPRYFLPVTATYSLRMQSNFHRKWLMHLNPSWGM